MKTIVVATDFTESSKNALDYACGFVKGSGTRLLLVYIYTIPISFAADGLSLVGLNNTLDTEGSMIGDEIARAKVKFPDTVIEGKTLVGNFLDSMQEIALHEKPEMIVLGAGGEYAEMWSWGNNWLDALVEIKSPVLVIPKNNVYKPIKQFALACDYKIPCSMEQKDTISAIVNRTGANLHIVHVRNFGVVEDKTKTEAFRAVFKDIAPIWHLVENDHIIKGFLSSYLDFVIIYI